MPGAQEAWVLRCCAQETSSRSVTVTIRRALTRTLSRRYDRSGVLRPPDAVHALDEGVLEVALLDCAGEVEEVEDVGVAGELLGELAVAVGELGGEVGGRGADPRCSWFMTCCWSTLRDQPCSWRRRRTSRAPPGR